MGLQAAMMGWWLDESKGEGDGSSPARWIGAGGDLFDHEIHQCLYASVSLFDERYWSSVDAVALSWEVGACEKKRREGSLENVLYLIK